MVGPTVRAFRNRTPWYWPSYWASPRSTASADILLDKPPCALQSGIPAQVATGRRDTSLSAPANPRPWPREPSPIASGRPTDTPPRPGRSGSGRPAGIPYARRPAKGRTGPRTTRTGPRERPLNAGDHAKHVGKSTDWPTGPCVWMDGGTQSQVHTRLQAAMLGRCLRLTAVRLCLGTLWRSWVELGLCCRAVTAEAQGSLSDWYLGR